MAQPSTMRVVIGSISPNEIGKTSEVNIEMKLDAVTIVEPV
ncbi:MULTISPECIES: hypothetical protein [Paenibacillus]|nr:MULTISPECIES: hypothetical protein [Paenibacillus]